MSWPENVGILAIELIFPSLYVDQTELEAFDGVSAGKYTVGLGQSRMGFCTDREDINSMCMTVVQRLIEKYEVKFSEIGRLEVGTETIVDKSKSVKSVLMELFEKEGCFDVEGVDTTNACYGGTSALFNSISWVESSAWDGRYALVVAGDIAVYAKGSARPTGGAGAMAMLIGPNAPLVFDRGIRASYMRHAYDFYKPDFCSEYPKVDGKLSIQCYLDALDNCYSGYCKKMGLKGNEVNLDYFDAILFHTPYCKLVQKSLARLALNDFIKNPDQSKYNDFSQFKDVKLNETYFNREIEQSFMTYTKQIFESKTKPSLYIANQVGNMYTPSIYCGLVSLLISKTPEELSGNKIGLFSYGSGLASSMFSITVKNNPDALKRIVDNLKPIRDTLDNKRICVSPEKFSAILQLREENCHKAPYEPQGDISQLFEGTFYLDRIDDMHRRTYKRFSGQILNGNV
ncbi:hydroxymethylglutaryl-CoA synthase 1 [Onthophagus taurus]|uniref:hydroxymethylglutaryl-CoA synthase 1 n=1 Tax=Onthophagus taurus TaxID=166361 RepID=UPI000C209451|nr:hydroxymethylglutaryl-CoA synthase 1 [Onthophagus taurus]